MALQMDRIGNQLFKAAREGNLVEFNRIFNESHSRKPEEEVWSLLVSEDDPGDGLLHCAVLSQRPAIVKKLLEEQWFSDADRNRELRVTWLKSASSEDDKPLKVAQTAGSEYTEIQQMLLNAARKDTLGTVEGDENLKWDSYEAAWSQWLDIIEHPERKFSECMVNETRRWLLSLKLDKNAPNERKEKADDIMTKIMRGAAECGLLEPLCDSAAAERGILLQAARDGNTLLLKSVVQLKDWDLLKRMLSIIDAKDNTVLHHAVKSRRVSALKVLLGCGQQQTDQRDDMILNWLDTRNKDKHSPLDLILMAGRGGSKMLDQLKHYLLNYTHIAFSKDEVAKYKAQEEKVKQAIGETTRQPHTGHALEQSTTVTDALRLQYLWSIVDFLRRGECRHTLMTWRQLKRRVACAKIMHDNLPKPNEPNSLADEIEMDIDNLLHVSDKIDKVTDIVNSTGEGKTPMELLMGPTGDLQMLHDMLELGIDCDKGVLKKNILHVAADIKDQNILIKLYKYFETRSKVDPKTDIENIEQHLKEVISKLKDTAKNAAGADSAYIKATEDAKDKIVQDLSIPLEGVANTLRQMLLQLDAKGETPLHIAARGNHAHHIKTLIKLWKRVLGSDKLDDLLTFKDGKGRVPFLSAAAGGAVNSALLLVTDDGTGDVYAQDKDGKNALTIAMENDHALFVKMLMFQTEGEGRELLDYELKMSTKIQATTGHSDTEAVQPLGKRYRKKMFNCVDKYGLNVVHHAVISQKEGMLQILLQSDAIDCLFVKDSDQERTPYLWAVTTGNLTIMKMIFRTLITTKKEMFAIKDVDKNGNTAGHIAAEFGHRNIIEYLNHRNINLFIGNNEVEIPLELAIEHGQLDVVKYLVKDCRQLDWGVDLSRVLVQATKKGHKQVVQYLLNIKDPIVPAVGHIDKNPFNLLDTAINDRNPVMATAILSTSKRNQVLSGIYRGLTPFQKLLKYMPDVAATLLNQYITKGASDFEVNFSLLEEQRGTISGHRLHLGNTDINLQENNSVAGLERSILRDWPQDRDSNRSVAIFDKDGTRKQPEDNMDMNERFQIIVDGQKFYLEPECRGFSQYWPKSRLHEFIQRKNHHPLKLLMDSQTDELIQHPVTMSCIMHHWDLYSPSYYFSTFIMLLYSVVLAINVTGQAWKQTYESAYGLPLDVMILCTMVLCCLAAGLGIFRELIQCSENGLGYITWGNFFDLASYVMTLMAVLPWTWTWQHKHLLGAFAVLITCLNTLFYMRALPLLGIFICMLRNTLMTLLGYFPGLLALILIFAVCFQIVMLKLVAFNNYCTSAVSIYVMLTGELDYSARYLPSEDADPSLPSEPERQAGMVLLVVTITVMSIIVANLLIGLAVCDVRDLTRNAEKHVLIIKGKMILDDLFNIMSRWIRQCVAHPTIKGESSTLTIPVQHNSKGTKANRLISWCQTKIRHPLTKKSIGEKISKLPAGTEEVTTQWDGVDQAHQQ